MLDLLGLAPLAAAEARDLLAVIDDRSQTHSTIVTAQLPIDEWHAVIADPSLADAVLDRLVHNAHKLILRGDPMRKSRTA